MGELWILNMRDYLKQIMVQATAIILAAGAAALFTFFQSLASQTGICVPPGEPVQQSGALGALFKGIHSAFTMSQLKYFS